MYSVVIRQVKLEADAREKGATNTAEGGEASFGEKTPKLDPTFSRDTRFVGLLG